MAMAERTMTRPRVLAEQAEWDATCSRRKARAAKDAKSPEDAKQGIEDLREEGNAQSQ